MLRKQFTALEPKGKTMASLDDLDGIAKRIGVPTEDIGSYLGSSGHKNNELVSFDDFIEAATKIKGSQGVIQINEKEKKIRIHGHKGDTMHTLDEDECISFINHINTVLSNDKLLADILPLDPTSPEDLVEACKDGIILAKLINNSSPNSIDERVLNTNKPLSAFQIIENLNLVIKTAESLEISTVNVGAQDLLEGRLHLLLGMVWQVIKLKLKQNVALAKHPELYRLLKEDETIADFIKESPESNIIRWVNYHLSQTPHGPVKNLSSDFKDGRAFLYLLNEIDSNSLNLQESLVLPVEDRIQKVIALSNDLGCAPFITSSSVQKGNSKLNFALLADLIHHRSGLESLDKDQLAELDAKLFSFESHIDSEAKHFLLWINSTLKSNNYLSSLDDLNDGIVLLKLYDSVYPNSVDWKKRVYTDISSINKFKKLANTNYLIELCKKSNFSLVGIQGADITENSPMATKSVIWQLMRASLLMTLASLSSIDGVTLTESDIVSWANKKLKRFNSKSTISSCKDPSIRTSLFFLDLIHSIVPNTVNYDLVTDGVTNSNARLNAQYAISIARKLGVTLFTLPEDITSVNPKMVFIFLCLLMKFSNDKKKQHDEVDKVGTKGVEDKVSEAREAELKAANAEAKTTAKTNHQDNEEQNSD